MKKGFILLMGCMGCISIFAQKPAEPKVPAAVKTAFATQFPGEKVLAWEKEGANYEAEYDKGGAEQAALFDASGKLLAKESVVSALSIPQQVKLQMDKVAPGAVIGEVVKITFSDGKQDVYEIKANHKEYVFDASGAALKGSGGGDEGEHGSDGSDGSDEDGDDGSEGSKGEKGSKGSDAKGKSRGH
jgi:hypothetical protein